MWTGTCLVLLVAAVANGLLFDTAKKPNIVFIVADDLGYSDIGFRNGDIISPNIDKLASEGVVLENSYVQPVCSPSRTAMLSGRYPFKLGMQRVVSNGVPHCLPTDTKLMPQHLKKLGYKTHMVGKWHLGFCNEKCLPNNRGFDTFMGIYNGGGDKYRHTSRGSGLSQGYDFWNYGKPYTAGRGVYSEQLYDQRAKAVIQSHNASNPLFLWVAFQNVHTPVDVPAKYVNKYSSLSVNDNQKKFYGMVTYMDDVVGNIVKSLKARGMYDNTIVVFTSDNGGDKETGANNYPFKGGKNTLYEGGIRAATVVFSPLTVSGGTERKGMFHASDWLPTLLTAAQGEHLIEDDLDGVNQWDMITGRATKSARTENIITYEQRKRAVISGNYKLIIGNAGTDDTPSPKPTAVNSKGRRQAGPNGPNRPGANRPNRPSGPAAGGGGGGGTGGAGREGGPLRTTQLYNIKTDPGETTNIADKNPDKVAALTKILNGASRMAVTDTPTEVDPKADPSNFGGNWDTGWC